MKLAVWMKAIFLLEDLLFRAKHETPLIINMFSANALLGECYLEVGDPSLAKKCFLSAFSHKEMKTKELERSVYHGLYMCYMQLGDMDRSLESKEYFNCLNKDTGDDIALALEKADAMEHKLIGVSAKAGIVTNLQRATPKYLFTKRTAEKLQQELKKKKKDLEALKDDAKESLKAMSFPAH